MKEVNVILLMILRRMVRGARKNRSFFSDLRDNILTSQTRNSPEFAKKDPLFGDFPEIWTMP